MSKLALIVLLCFSLGLPCSAEVGNPDEPVQQDKHGWVEDETVTVITPNGYNADVFSESTKAAIQESRVQKQLAKKTADSPAPNVASSKK